MDPFRVKEKTDVSKSFGEAHIWGFARLKRQHVWLTDLQGKKRERVHFQMTFAFQSFDNIVLWVQQPLGKAKEDAACQICFSRNQNLSKMTQHYNTLGCWTVSRRYCSGNASWNGGWLTVVTALVLSVKRYRPDLRCANCLCLWVPRL